MGKIKHRTITSRTDFFYYAFRNILLVGLPLTIISGLVLSHLSLHSSATSSNSGTDNLAITISTSCTLGSVVNTPHSKEVYNGNYETNIGKTTITTLCNDGNGYSIYANGYSNNEEGNNRLINTEYPQYSIDTGLATSGLTSQWAMKLNNIENDPSPTPPTIDGSYNDTYGLVPTQWTKVAYRQSGTTDMSEGSSFTTTYSVYASSSQYNGTYNGQVKYVLLHPYKNDSTITTVPTFEESFAISGKETVSINGEDYYKMQDMNSYICERVSNAAETPTIQLVDIRDNKIYWVAKLADNNCWMTQNLDLDITSDPTSPSYIALNSNNTDLSTDESVYTDPNTIYALKGENDTYGYTYENGVATWIPERSTIAYNQLSSSTWVDSSTDPYSYNRLDNNGNLVYPDSNVSRAIAGDHGLSGNYYNWTATVASNNSTNAKSTNPNQANSICPKGWRLPNVTNKEFGNLLVAYGIINTNTSTSYASTSSVNFMGAAPLYFVRGGDIRGGSLGTSGSSGFYWSSTFNSTANAYNLYYTRQDMLPQGQGSNMYYGRSIRCLAR